MKSGVYLLVLTMAVETVASGQTIDIDQLIDEALTENPGLQALRYEAQAQAARVSSASALADPMLKIELSNLPLRTFDFDSTPMSGKQFMLSQRIPYWGKRRARAAIENHVTQVSQAAYEDHVATIVNDVKQAVYDLAFLDRAIAITEKNRNLLKDFVRIAQTKYAVGTGLQQDVLKAQVSLSELRDRLIVLTQERRRTEARLNAVLDRTTQAPIGSTGIVKQTPVPYGLDELQQMAVKQSSYLQGMEHKTRRWRIAERLARLTYRPDFNLNLGYRQRDFTADPVKGSDFLTVGVGVNLPIYRGGKQDHLVREALAKRKASEARYDAAKRQVFLRIEQAHIDIQTHRQESVLYQSSIIPQAEQALAAAIAAYQVGKVDFITLLSNQIALLNFEIKQYHHLTEGEKALARLEATVGKRLF
jgi:cobalt-zinc-cadmium efflux system outer membrane protein